jgi:hypothetical protein
MLIFRESKTAMAAASVMTMPTYPIVYPAGVLTTIDNVVTRNVVAYRDETGEAHNLVVGASSNLVAQAVENIDLQHGVDKEISMIAGDTEYLSVSYSNNRVIVDDVQNGGITLKTTDAYIGGARFVESVGVMTLSMPTLTSGLQVESAVAMQSTLAVALDTTLNQNLFVTGDTGLGGRLVSYGGVFTPKVSMYKETTANGASQVGYTWRINDTDQLELIKYNFFGEDTPAVSRKIAVFGNSTIMSGDASDVIHSASLITTSSASTGSGTGSGPPGFSSATSAFTVTPNGSMYTQNTVAIGQEAIDPDVTLQINGTTKSINYIATENVSSPAFLTTSDERLKDLYAHIDGPLALAGIMNLSPLKYSWKTDETHTQHAGFTAQNISAQLPLAVQTATANDMVDAMHIDNTAVLAYLVAAVKEIGTRMGV